MKRQPVRHRSLRRPSDKGGRGFTIRPHIPTKSFAVEAHVDEEVEHGGVTADGAHLCLELARVHIWKQSKASLNLLMQGLFRSNG